MTNRQSRPHSARRALTLFEVVASTMIVGIMAVAVLNSLGAATKSSQSISDRAVALALADELMAEIQLQAYKDPDGSAVFGPEGAESSGPRSAFDDVDDYHGWNKSPPQSREGTPIIDDTNWRQKVDVTYVQPANPTLPTAGNTDLGAKRVKVTIEYKGHELARLFAVRTARDEP
jgi:MSHA pilin protein MshD